MARTTSAARGDEEHERRCAALRALLTILQSYPIRLKDRQLLGADPEQRLEAHHVVAFLKRTERSRDIYTDVLRAVSTVLQGQTIRLPYECKSLVDFLGIRVESGGALDAKLPFFLNRNDLVEGTDDGVWSIINIFEGCWRVYRIDSRSTKSGDSLSTGLLSIYPSEIARTAASGIPMFSFRQISEASKERRDWDDMSIIRGVVKYSHARVTLLGWKNDPGRIWPVTGEWTWHQPNISARHSHFIEGAALIPTSDGSDIIGSYFLAEFISGSNELRAEDYDGLIEQERQGLGTHKVAELIKAWTSSEETEKLERVRRLISESSENHIFSHVKRS